jgi:hypothetical protein
LASMQISTTTKVNNPCGGLSKARMELTYDPGTPFLGMYQKEMKSTYSRDTCIFLL